MKIFVSWSGPKSGAVAEALRDYLPFVNPAFEPWFSPKSIPKGSRSTEEIADALADAKAGIICLTQNNLSEPWILFEAGAIAKTVEKKPLACPLLIDLQPSQVPPPLGNFQHTTNLTEGQLLALMETLNEALGKEALPEAHIKKAFALCWPKLEERFRSLPSDGPTGKATRAPDEMLADILDTVRRTQQDTEVLKQAELLDVRGTTEILARLATITAAPNSFSHRGQMGLSGIRRLSDLLHPEVRTPTSTMDVLASSDASTTGNETPLTPAAAELFRTLAKKPDEKAITPEEAQRLINTLAGKADQKAK